MHARMHAPRDQGTCSVAGGAGRGGLFGVRSTCIDRSTCSPWVVVVVGGGLYRHSPVCVWRGILFKEHHAMGHAIFLTVT